MHIQYVAYNKKDNKMRILHLTWSLGMGGIETMLVNIANAQALAGCDVSLIVINDQVEESLIKRIDQNVRLITLNRKLGQRNPLPFANLNYLIWKGKYDVIHCHHENLINVIAPVFRNNCCYTQHSVSSQGIVNRRQLLKYKAVFAISHAVANHIYEKCRIKPIVVKNGIAVEDIYKRDYHGVDSKSRIKIVAVGRLLVNVKGQDILLKAMTFLKKNVYLDIIGEGPDKSFLDNMVNEFALSDRVELVGKLSQDEVFGRLKDYDIYVLPSRTEGFGLSVAEAMAAMLPVVVSDIEGPSEIVNKGRYGHLFCNENAESCAKAIQSVIENYDSENVLQEAYNHIMENYSVNRTAREYIENYKLLVL